MRTRIFYFAVAAALLSLIACNKEDEKKDADYITINPSSLTLKGDGETAKLSVETNVEGIECRSSESWLTATLSGKELTVVAEQNGGDERVATVTVSGGDASAELKVTQAKGSKYPGHTELSEADCSYSGSAYYKLYSVPADADGGQMSLSLTSADGRHHVVIEMFTAMFASEDEVVLTPGQYMPGEDGIDEFGSLSYLAEKMTFVPGQKMVIEDEEGEEELFFGSYYIETVGETETFATITDGSLTVTEADGVYDIVLDLKSAEGKDIMFYYSGPVEIDTEFAVFGWEPSAKGDPTVFDAAECYYTVDGDVVELSLMLSDAATGYPTTNFTFYAPASAVSDPDNIDVSGMYYQADEESGTYEGDPGTVLGGSLMDLGGFSFPMGSYIVWAPMEYFIPDGMVSLILEKTEDGSYLINFSMADAGFTEFYMAIDETSTCEIAFYDNADFED